MNAILKMDIIWKPKKVPGLVDIFYDDVNCQLLDLKKALYGSGNYQLTSGYGQYWEYL